ncbi:MAG: HEAT repeat domain-containing protein [Flavobacteriaceae bacterium]
MDLTVLFLSLGIVYFAIIFLLKGTIGSSRKRTARLKREFSPMLSEFLFYEESLERADKKNFVELKIKMRELLGDTFNRKLLAQMLLDLSKDISGDARKVVYKLYQDFELQNDAYERLKSWRWERVSKAILELTDMRVTDAYGLISKFLNDRRNTVRKQAELATVTLKSEGITYFMDTTRYKISEWQQIQILNVLRHMDSRTMPDFSNWFVSKNRDVVLLALRLVRHFNQNNARKSLVYLLGHKNDMVKEAAIDCIRKFHISEAMPVLKKVFWKNRTDVKMYILGAIGQLGMPKDIPFLKEVERKESNFYIKSKALATINVILPESIMPTEGIVANKEMAALLEQQAPQDLVDAPEIPLEPEETQGTTEDSQNKVVSSTELVRDTKKEELNLEFLPLVVSNKEGAVETDKSGQPPEPLERYRFRPQLPLVDARMLSVDFEHVEGWTSREPMPLDEALKIDFLPEVTDITKDDKNKIDGANNGQNGQTDTPRATLAEIIVDYEEVPFVLGKREEKIRVEQEGMENLPEDGEAQITEEELTELLGMLPKSMVYDHAIFDKMSLLNDIEIFGDEREIPLLREYLETEADATVRERIKQVLQRLSLQAHSKLREGPTPKMVETAKVTQIELMFNDCDLAERLILLDVIKDVVDLEDIPFLERLAAHHEPKLAKEGKKLLDRARHRAGVAQERENLMVRGQSAVDHFVQHMAKEEMRYGLREHPEPPKVKSDTNPKEGKGKTSPVDTFFKRLRQLPKNILKTING